MKLLKKLIIQSSLLLVSMLKVSNQVDSSYNVNRYSNMFVLGDSLSDTGAFVQYSGSKQWRETNPRDDDYDMWSPSGWGMLPTSTPQTQWVPASFNRPFYKNSFSNGPVAVEIVAKQLKLKNFKSASYYEDNFDNFGYNYATGGTTILSAKDSFFYEFAELLKEKIFTDKYNLENQIKILKQHHQKISSNDLLIINIGSNDVIKAITAATLKKNTVNNNRILKRLKKTARVLFERIEELADYGFNKIAICNLAYLDETPRYRNTEKVFIAEYMDSYFSTEFAINFRKVLIDPKYTKKIRLLNVRSFFNKYLNKSKKNGIIIDKPAVAINWMQNFLNSEYSPYYINGANIDNDKNYAFFDDIHPSKDFHQYVGSKMYEVINQPWIN